MLTMKMYMHLLYFAMVATVITSAIPRAETEEETHKSKHLNRPYEAELSDDEHFVGDEHKENYDHQAFLGKEEAQEYDDLTPEESKERLSLIYDKIDKDGDERVTQDELHEWIQYVQRKYVVDDTVKQWAEQEPDTDSMVTWTSYKSRTYGDMDEEDEFDDGDDGYNYKDMVRRDEKRWYLADQDNNGKLDQKEFADFLHPEDAKHMRDIVVEETLEDIDKDHDGVISLDEYIEDMWPAQDRNEDVPDWVITEREQFTSFRDKNNDGYMDKEEVADWIIPDDYDHSDAESKHLIYESDTDKDGMLSREEVLQKYNVFVGSQATDFGEALTRHDEF